MSVIFRAGLTMLFPDLVSELDERVGDSDSAGTYTVSVHAVGRPSDRVGVGEGGVGRSFVYSRDEDDVVERTRLGVVGHDDKITRLNIAEGNFEAVCRLGESDGTGVLRGAQTRDEASEE